MPKKIRHWIGLVWKKCPVSNVLARDKHVHNSISPNSVSYRPYNSYKFTLLGSGFEWLKDKALPLAMGYDLKKWIKIKREKRKKNLVSCFGGLHYQCMANPANQPIPEKLPK